jgi:hypothetical protein
MDEEERYRGNRSKNGENIYIQKGKNIQHSIYQLPEKPKKTGKLATH